MPVCSASLWGVWRMQLLGSEWRPDVDRSLRTKHVNWSSFSTSKQLCPQPWKFSKKPLKTSQIVTQSAKSHYKSYIIKPSLGQQEYIQYIPILSSMPSSWSRMNWAPLYLNHKISHYPMYLDNKSSNHCKKNLRYLIYIYIYLIPLQFLSFPL